MTWWELIGLLVLCSFVAWVYLHIIADIICPPDLARRARVRREQMDDRRARIVCRRVYDQESE